MSEPIHPVDGFDVGEFTGAEGELGLILGFELNGEWTRYRLHPMAAVEIVNAMSAWLDDHDPDPT